MKLDTSSDRLPNLITKACAFETHWSNIPKDKAETDNTHDEELFRDDSALNVLRRDILALGKTQNDQHVAFEADKLLQDLLKRCPILTKHIMERFSQIAQHIGVGALGNSPYSHKDVPPFGNIT